MRPSRPGPDSVIDFQVVQGEDDRLRILVVQRDTPAAEADRERIVETFERLVQPPERPTIERVGHIPLTPGGKLRTLISANSSPARNRDRRSTMNPHAESPMARPDPAANAVPGQEFVYGTIQAR